jgi:transcriptional regulator GlxA family with amidase domain
MAQKIYFLIFDEVEVLDFTGPFDVFSMANAAANSMNQPDLFELLTISPDGKTVTAMHGLSINPNYSIDTCPIGSDDILIVPGGTPPSVLSFYDDHPEVLPWLTAQQAEVKVLASICVGALIAAPAMAFQGKTATTHHQFLGQLETMLAGQNATVVPGVRYVDNPGTPTIMASAGVSAGLDLAFYLLRKLTDADITNKTMDIMEYNGTRNWVLG